MRHLPLSGQPLEIPSPLARLRVSDFTVERTADDHVLRIIIAWKVSTILMAKDGLSDCARIYAEAKGAAIETAEKFIYVLMVQLFMKNLDTRDTLPSAVGLIRELMGEPPGDRKMNEFAMATLLLAGSTRTASVSLETDFSAIEQKARREKRVDPRLSEASHYETQSDSRVVRFFEPSQSHPEYRAIIWKLRNGDMLFHWLSISKTDFDIFANLAGTMLDDYKRVNKWKKPLWPKVIEALMMRMVVYVACSPNASPKNRQTSVLTSQALERISRIGLDALPDDLLKDMEEGGKEAISMILDLLYKNLSRSAKHSEKVLY